MRHHATPGELSAKQRRAVEALLSTGEVSAAAREAGVNRATLYRWLKEPAFLAAVRSAEADALDELSRLLVRLGRTAVATLAKAMSDAGTPPATKVRAADAALGRLLQLRELAQLEARVQALEQAAGARAGGRAMRLGQRVDRLERPEPGGRLPLWALQLAERLAAEHELDPRLVVAETEAILTEAEAAGVLGSEEGWTAFLVAEGFDPDSVLAEARRLVGLR